MERDGEKTKGVGAANEYSPENQTLKKKFRYRYFSKYSLLVGQEENMKQAIKKRLVFRGFEGEILAGSRYFGYLKHFAKGTQNPKLCFSLEDEHIKLREALKRHRSLKKVEVLMKQGFNEEQMKSLSGGLERLQNCLFYFNASDLGDQELKAVGRCFKRMQHLRSVRMKFYVSGASVKGLKALGKGFKRLAFLTDINFRSYVLEHKVLQGLGQGLKGMRSEAKVNFISDFFYTYDQDVEMLRPAMKWLGSIQKLGFELNSVSKTAIEVFSESFSVLKLKSLLLKFSNSIDKQVRETFIENLGSASHLEILHLKFPPLPIIQERDFTLLDQSLPKLHSLKDLRLNFSQCKSISDETLEALGQTFEKLVSLKSVGIELPSLPNCTSKGFHVLKGGLTKAKDLEKIKLRLFQFIAVNDDDVQELMESLEGLSSLREIDIFFNCVPRLTGKALDAIGDSVKRMPSLRSVQINFEKCEAVSENDVNDVIEKLKELPIKLECKNKAQAPNSLFD